MCSVLRRTSLFALFLLTFTFSVGFAQQREIILLKDKANNSFSLGSPEEFLSERALQRRERQGIALSELDLPVSPAYVEAVEATGATVVYQSKWLNALMVEATAEQLVAIEELDFVAQRGFPAGRTSGQRFRADEECDTELGSNYFGNAENQSAMLGLGCLLEEDMKGQGMMIAVLDDGFYRVDLNAAFNHLEIADVYDFVDNDTELYDEIAFDHGTNVLSVMAANLESIMVGSAPLASYMLYRTEDGSSETKYEEFFWLLAVERADEKGADVVNSSLVYFDFDPPYPQYSVGQLDGNTALITQAADWAARTGMLVVQSAGNEGGNSWNKIVFPADADSVLTVGGVSSSETIAPFSGRGPTADGRIKPDVVARGQTTAIISAGGSVSSANGTSFSTPLMAGFAAVLWQKYPELTNMELIETLRESGDRAETPDNSYGYGIPAFSRFKAIMDGKVTALEDELFLGAILFPNPSSGNTLFLQLPKELIGKSLEIAVLSTEGRILFSESESLLRQEEYSLKVPKLPQGIYLVQLRADGQSRTFRWAKM